MQLPRGLAEAARKNNPTSPAKASDEFEKAFEKAFGDPTPTASIMPLTPDSIAVFLATPLARAQTQLMINLRAYGSRLRA
jgi:hypothetical protein